MLKHEICQSVIHVNERMTYTAVNRILTDNDQELKNRYRGSGGRFPADEGTGRHHPRRSAWTGRLDFDFPESKVIVDENGFPLEIKRYESGPGEMLIEDFMIKANEVVAEHLHWQEMPFFTGCMRNLKGTPSPS